MPSKNYENGSITYKWGNYRPSKYHYTGPPDEPYLPIYGKNGEIPVLRIRTRVEDTPSHTCTLLRVG